MRGIVHNYAELLLGEASRDLMIESSGPPTA